MPDAGVLEEVLAPQPGPQSRFVSSAASVVFYGGAANGGKSYGLLMDPLRDIEWPGFRGILFRRTTPEITAEGGLWDVSHRIYPRHGARSRDIPHLDWRFPSGARLKLSHMQTDADRIMHQGAQYTWIGFDEVTHFSAVQFWYLFGRLRLSSATPLNGVPARLRVRCTCNPDPRSWVAEFLAWWIDQDTGFAIPERAGVIRWFARDAGRTIWGSTVAEVREQAPHLFIDGQGLTIPWARVCHSATFIPSKYTDNAISRERDPTYEARLRSLNAVDRARLLDGNWKITESAGEMFREEWFPIVTETPPDVVARVRYWDLAGSKRRRSNHSAGIRFCLHADGTYTVEDVENEKLRPKGTEDLLERTAARDGVPVDIHIEQDVGGGELLVDQYQRHALRGYTVHGHKVRGEGTKQERAKPVSSAAEKGHIRLRRAAWNKPFLAQLEAFPDSNEDDMVDALSGAFAVVQEAGDVVMATARTR